VDSLALVEILCESDSLSEPLNDADVLVEPDWLVLLDILVESLSNSASASESDSSSTSLSDSTSASMQSSESDSQSTSASLSD
ncbi:hypothetical protein, partial [Staphylococcus aureus]